MTRPGLTGQNPMPVPALLTELPRRTTTLRAVDRSPAGFSSRAADAGLVLTAPLAAGEIAVDLQAYLVTLAGRPVELSPRQVELLALFLAAPRRVWSREQLHWVCWGDTSRSRRVDVQLCRLRARLGLGLFRNVRDRGWALHAFY